MSYSFVVRLAFGVGAMLPTTTTASETDPIYKLPYCEEIATFYRTTYGDSSTASAHGQCLPSLTPGAYYTSPGEKDGEDDRVWACWNDQMDKSIWTNEEAETQGFTGACIFKDYSSTKKPSDVEDCRKHLNHNPAVCAPGPKVFWGACYSSHSEIWKCIPQGDPTIAGLAKGDCKAQVLQDGNGKPTKNFYDGVCTFPLETPKVYKCETVTSYTKVGAGQCGGFGADKACFSLKKDVNWVCKKRQEPMDVPCDWTLEPRGGTKTFYRGHCVFKGSKDWKDALDAHSLTETEKNHLEL